MPISTVELFAGVGGFRLGLQEASNRFITIWANQWEPCRKNQYAFSCYTAHFGERPQHVNEDIALAIDKIPSHQLLVGGFPCQDYSVARTNATGIEGKKGVLWWEINRIIKKHHPPYILLENVDRLLKSPSKQRGRDFGVMLRCLNDHGYAVEWRVINAAEYGYAQKRRRVFIFGFHTRAPFHNSLQHQPFEFKEWIEENGFFAPEFPIMSLETKAASINLNDFKDIAEISDCFNFEFHNSGVMRNGIIYSAQTTPVYMSSKKLGQILDDGIVDERYFINNQLEKWKYLKGAKREPRVRPNGESYFYTEGAIPFPDPLHTPARTILTSESSMNRSTHVINDPSSNRYRLLTPTECERLNGFPTGWTNTGMPEKARYFMMGNALVVPLITKMGHRLSQIIPED